MLFVLARLVDTVPVLMLLSTRSVAPATLRVVVPKFSVLPGHLAAAIETIGRAGAGEVVVQATGLGLFRTSASASAILDLRSAFERRDGSLVVLRQPAEVIDTWGKTGDSFALMKAVKQQFDPNGTLNPGRFVGGI